MNFLMRLGTLGAELAGQYHCTKVSKLTTLGQIVVGSDAAIGHTLRKEPIEVGAGTQQQRPAGVGHMRLQHCLGRRGDGPS